jgi:alpha-amylase/alpha-mannosidase (GH57 family)
VQAFARGEAHDRHLELGLKPADSLSEDERAFCVGEFFHAHRPRMIDPYPRYRELLELRGNTDGGLSARLQAAQFSADDIRDLQVWHKLVWIDAEYHEHDERVRALVARGRGYSEEDKETLRRIELEILRKVIPEYAAAAARGQIELSTSPFYHPILPLLCDTDVYLRSHPQSRMPREPFRHPEDAAEQLSRAIRHHEDVFGRRPEGVWPSEGSVSDAMVPLVAQAGFRWMATDEEILARTLGITFTRDGDGHVQQPERLYRPYRIGSAPHAVSCGFRDHALSDLVGFSYGSWSADGAANDFVSRLTVAGRNYRARSGGEEATIFVILDGENAWEYYDGQGRPFLRALYGRLAADPGIRTVTMSEACANAEWTLPSIFPGSWINADFYIWIGHPDDHRGWSQLVDARRALDAAGGSASPAALAQAREELLIAEGSDWFWWYGDDHSSDQDVQFDELFRRHVRNVYRALDRPVPEELFVTNITTAPPITAIEQPTGFIHPVIDGAVTSYFEWIGAGYVDKGSAGAMHQVAAAGPVVELIEFGCDLEHLFVRIDGAGPMKTILQPDTEVRLTFIQPAGLQVVIKTTRGGVCAQLRERHDGAKWQARACEGLKAAAGDILEVQIPFRGLDLKTHDRVAFLAVVIRGDAEVEHHPRHAPIELEVPDQDFTARNWTA